jgi:hypothetical protein
MQRTSRRRSAPGLLTHRASCYAAIGRGLGAARASATLPTRGVWRPGQRPPRTVWTRWTYDTTHGAVAPDPDGHRGNAAQNLQILVYIFCYTRDRRRRGDSVGRRGAQLRRTCAEDRRAERSRSAFHWLQVIIIIILVEIARHPRLHFILVLQSKVRLQQERRDGLVVGHVQRHELDHAEVVEQGAHRPVKP